MPLDARRFATRRSPATAARGGSRSGAAGRGIGSPRLFRAGLHGAAAAGDPERGGDPRRLVAAHPEWFRPREGARRSWLTKASARRAASVITISEFSKRELIERLDVPADKIHVIPPGIGAGGSQLRAGGSQLGARRSVSSPSAQPPASSAYRVLFVGSIFNRRRVIDLIRAFAPIARSHPGAALDIVGDNRTLPARRPAADHRRGATRCASALARIRQRRATGGALRRRARVRLSVRIRGARPDAARSARRGYPAGSRRHAGGARKLRACRRVRPRQRSAGDDARARVDAVRR